MAALVARVRRGARDGGMIATIKHFPGHGDTDVDSHLGLPVITFVARGWIAWSSCRSGAASPSGAQAVMAAHIELPASIRRRPRRRRSAGRSSSAAARRARVRRPRLHRFDVDGRGDERLATPGEAAVRALLAGADQVLHSPDPDRGVNGVKAAVAAGALPRRGSTRRSRACCAPRRLPACTSSARRARRGAGAGRRPRAPGDCAEAVSAIDHAREGRSQSGAAGLPRDAPVLYLSVLDYPSGWQIAAPSRTVDSGAEEALAAGHVDRSVGPHAARGARSRARGRAAVRRRRRGGLRARDVGQRTAGSRRPELVRLLNDWRGHRRAHAVGGGVFRQSLHRVVHARAARGDADLRLLRPPELAAVRAATARARRRYRRPAAGFARARAARVRLWPRPPCFATNCRPATR